MHHINATDRLLLGTVGWQRPAWVGGYFPTDLPPDWRLAYYANDCDCVLLPAVEWCAGERGGLEAAVAEAPEGLMFFLEVASPASTRIEDCLEIFPEEQTVLLTDRPIPVGGDLPQWLAQGTDSWVDSGSGARLLRWSIDTFDMRGLRARAEGLDRSAQALVLDGPAADPARVPELRTLLELMGRA